MSSKFKIVRQKASSEKYGVCDICGKFVSDVHTFYFFNFNLSFWGHLECVGKFIDPKYSTEDLKELYYIMQNNRR